MLLLALLSLIACLNPPVAQRLVSAQPSASLQELVHPKGWMAVDAAVAF